MNADRSNRQTKKWIYLSVLICILIMNMGAVQVQSNCSIIYDAGNGWILDMCTADPAVTTPMEVLVNGVSQGNAAVVRIYHRSQNGPGTPQVAVIYASGYVRLKQNADPSLAIPFGTSFVLGPAYWPSSSTYYHHPQLNRFAVDTTWLPGAPLRMQVQGTNQDFDVSYEMTLPPPRDSQTRLHVTQTYTARADVSIDPVRRAERQGFKLVQASSMFINESGACSGGYSGCHDSNAARFIGNDLARHQTAFADLTLPGFIFASPNPLGSTWLDVLHTDDESWQSQTAANNSGNTPNARIALDDLPLTHTITPQGWIGSTTNPNDDNVGLWLHDDGPASISWLAGQSAQSSYWLLVQDNPPEPWTDLSLRPGSTFLDFEGSYNCFPVKDAQQPTSGVVTPISGYSDTALGLNYDLGSSNGNWAQVRCNFDPPLDLSTYDHLRFDWRGDPAAANSLQVGLINPTTGGEHIFARGYHHATQHGWWGQMVIPFRFLDAWTPGTQFDPSQVSALFISVVKDPVADAGGSGSIAIDNLSAEHVASRSVPGSFVMVTPNETAARAAALWLAAQQQPTGLLKSWQEESSCLAHTYDQALALMVFADQGMRTEADALVEALAAAQNADGSWFKSRDCLSLEVTGNDRWEGDIAWAIYALGRYLELGGTRPQATIALQKGADWLATRVNLADGCLAIDHTEGTLDAWWAFQVAGTDHAADANRIRDCLMTYYWDEAMGRFKGGRNWWQPYLDNQTWGAAFLRATGQTEKALRALSYARDVLRVPAQGAQLAGLDGQAGPWSVWNEGTAQYIAVGGDGSQDLLLEVLAQQQEDGGMSGSPDEFNGGGVWTTRWHGVAPTAWLYNALCGEPFHPGSQSRCTQDTRAPVVSSIVRAGSNPTSAASVDFTLTFSEPVTGMDTTAPFTDFVLSTTGITAAAISAVSGSGSTWTVTVNSGSGDGTIRLDIPSTATITDLSGNLLGGLPVISGETYSIVKSSTIGAGIYDDRDVNWTFSNGWTNYDGAGPYHNTSRYTTTIGSEAQFTFTGNKFALTYVKASSRGSIDVYVDDTKVATINAYSSTTRWQQTWTSPALTPGVHTVRFVHAGSAGKYIDIDAIRIFEPPPTVGPGIYDDIHAAWVFSSGWTAYSGTGPYNSTNHYSKVRGSEAQITFNGNRFTMTYVKASNRSSIGVYVDGAKIATINAKASSTAWQQTWTSPTFTSGIHTVRFVHAGSSGTYIDVDAIQVFAASDLIAPSAIEDLAAAPGTDPGSVTLTWTAPGDDGSTGTATSYLVRYSLTAIGDEAAWNAATPLTTGIPMPAAAGTGESLTVSGLTPGTSYYFAVRAQDEEPNLAGLSNSPSAEAQSPAPVTSGMHDDVDVHWIYSGSWTAYTGTGPLNGTNHYTNGIGSAAQLTFTGTRFTFTYVKASNRGSIDIYVDGTKVGTLNARSTTLAWQATWTSQPLTPGQHTVRFVHAGGGTYIDVDAINILP